MKNNSPLFLVLFLSSLASADCQIAPCIGFYEGGGCMEAVRAYNECKAAEANGGTFIAAARRPATATSIGAPDPLYSWTFTDSPLAKGPDYARCQRDYDACGANDVNCYHIYLKCIGDPFGDAPGECINRGGAVTFVHGGHACTLCPAKVKGSCGFEMTERDRPRFERLPKWDDYHGLQYDGACGGCPASW